MIHKHGFPVGTSPEFAAKKALDNVRNVIGDQGRFISAKKISTPAHEEAGEFLICIETADDE